MKAEKLLYDVKEAAELLDISRSGIYRLKETKQLLPRKLGGRTVYHIDDLRRFAEGLPMDVEASLKAKGVKISS
jgi:hypothetical protein